MDLQMNPLNVNGRILLQLDVWH